VKKWLSPLRVFPGGFLVVAVGACGGSSSTEVTAMSPTNMDGGASADSGVEDHTTSVGEWPPSDGALAMPDRIVPVGPDGAPRTDGNGNVGPVTIESLQVAGTHNSYHIAPAVAFDASHKYTMPPLDQQLAGGLRAFELDLHLAAGVFQIYHIDIIDPNATCKTLDECLGVVATWSHAHLTHVPIFIWFELKDDTGGEKITDLVAIETAILKVFPKEQLITSAWLRGKYASPHERITMAGWPTIEEARGKIMFSIITRDARTQQYAHDFTSLDDRLMFVNPTPDQYGMPWASITKVDDLLDTASIAKAHAAHLIIDANICAINMKDDECQTRLSSGVSTGVHTLHDDLPFPISGRTYSIKLPGGSPGCNPVTAPAGCAPGMLE
jgi:Phosphoinositide phospholipase C, Ca2+-dependent